MEDPSASAAAVVAVAVVDYLAAAEPCAVLGRDYRTGVAAESLAFVRELGSEASRA